MSLPAAVQPARPILLVGGETLRGAGLTYVGTPLEGTEARVEDGFAAARYAGTGLRLLKRSVPERMVAAHPALRFRAIHTLEGDQPRSENLCALLDTSI